ncbi:hypothetical protein ACFL35_20455, partial [Candidatus Riflebacteria bacterium]
IKCMYRQHLKDAPLGTVPESSKSGSLSNGGYGNLIAFALKGDRKKDFKSKYSASPVPIFYFLKK